MSLSPVTFPPPDYYEMLQRFAVQGATSAGIPTVAALTKAGYVETVTQITASGRQYMKAEARRMRPVPPEASRADIEMLARMDPGIRKASGAVVSPIDWAKDLAAARRAMLVEGGQVADAISWADSGDEVRIVRPEFRVRLTPLGLEAVARFEEQQEAERRAAERIRALVDKGRVTDAPDAGGGASV
jgi:hypothetical protein